MSGICVVEINDAGIVLGDVGSVHVASPGYAALSGRELLFGEAAQARARLDPRRTFDRYWEGLDQQPLSRAAGPAGSHADLAYFHLHELWAEHEGQADEVLLLAPAGYDSDQLALLLGIAHACGMPVTGLAAAPVVAAAAADGDRPRLVLQAGLHRVSAAWVEAGDDLCLGQTRTLVRRGLCELDDAWASLIAKRFVHETRFDPLHDAVTEQSLYDGLPEWLATLRAADYARLRLDSRLRSHHIEIERGAVVSAAEPVYGPLLAAVADAGEVQVVLDHRLAALPGLWERIAERCGSAPERLAEDAITGAALEHAEAIRSDGQAPAYVTRLPATNVPVASPPANESENVAPTHLLQGWRAYPLGTQPLDVPPEGQAAGQIVARDGGIFLQADGTSAQVNNAAIERDRRLEAGDVVEIGGITMRLIIVNRATDRDGPA